jgi:hypothetical protein
MPETLTSQQFRLLRTISFAGVLGEPGDALGLADCDVAALVAELRAAGHVEEDLIALTDGGEATLQTIFDEEYARLADDQRRVMHEAFRPLDVEVKRLASAWQDSDARNDWEGRLEVIEGLEELHHGLASYLAGPAAPVERLDEYRRRIGAALERAQSGELDFVVGVSVDSYHTAWFHLHEDLLRILKEQRDPE